jgi:4-amino-4-deoxy-L-arabinose transferase-like glycosyltransferase
MIIAVNPMGNFPLNDDWAYGKSVLRLLETGRFDVPAWSAMNHITQIYWGALFCLPLGFSFTALRFSTLTMGLIGVLATYGLLREADADPEISFLGSLLLLVNPIYLGLSNTFMSDVPFLALAVLSTWLFIRGLRRGSPLALVGGLFFACAALLLRQSGLAIFIGFGTALIWHKGFRPINIFKALIPLVMGAGLQILFQIWLKSTGRISPFFGNPPNVILKIFQADWRAVIVEYAKLALETAIYSGMFLFPFVAIIGLRTITALPSRRRRWPLLWILGFSTITMAAFIRWNIWMPFTNNVMSEIGLGPLLLRDATFGPTNFPTPLVVKLLWMAMTIISVFGAACFFYFIFLAVRRVFIKRLKIESRLKSLTTLSFMVMVVYFVAMVTRGFFDRYLLPIWPFFLLLMSVTGAKKGEAKADSRTIAALCLILLLLFGGFALGATHDYLLWNRVRWSALSELMKDSHVTAKQIDGGMEFNGWYLFDLSHQAPPGKSWWWVERDDYVLAFAPMTGYDVLKRHRLKRWLPFGPENILVLRRREGAPAKQ